MWEIKRSGYENRLIAGFVLTGGGALLKHIESLVELHTGMPARIGEPVEHLSHGYSKDLSSPIYATAIGLLKYTIDNLPNKMYVEYDQAELNTGGFTNPAPIVNTEMAKSDDDFEDIPEGEKSNIENKFLGFVRKIGTYAKDFFEPTPDHEL